MNAHVSRLRLAPSPERRRAQGLREIAVGLAATELTVRATVPTLGDREAYLALRAVYEQLDAEMGRVERLADEFLDLAQASEAKNSE